MQRNYNPKRYYTRTNTGDNGVLREAYLENQKLRDKVKAWKAIAESLAIKMQGYPCACTPLKCECGHEDALIAYNEAVTKETNNG